MLPFPCPVVHAMYGRTPSLWSILRIIGEHFCKAVISGSLLSSQQIIYQRMILCLERGTPLGNTHNKLELTDHTPSQMLVAT